MKIAVASERDRVTQHFGHCANFNIYEAADGKIANAESVPNPGHRPGFLPEFLRDRGVNVIISGGMGGGAVELFDEFGIAVVTGAAGDSREAAEKYLRGELRSSGEVCGAHSFEDECGGHDKK